MVTVVNTAANRRLLVEALRMPEVAAAAWLACEAQGVPNPTNPLNIRHTFGSLVRGYTPSGFAVFESPTHGIAQASLILHRVRGVGYERVLAAIAEGDALRIASAIQDSSWAAGHYGHVCLERYVQRHRDGQPPPLPEPAPRDKMRPLPPPGIKPGRWVWVVRRGDTLWGIAARFYGRGWLWPRLALRNRVRNPRTLQVGRVLAIP